ncbi:MAG: histidine--tRNA ligase, partial [Nitrospinae bacterium]|nr:histidine--tRNA ligase [Nitrospinota bacterium]
ELQINSLGCKNCRPQYRETLKAAIQPHLNKLCTNCNQRYERNPLRVLDCKVEQDVKIARGLPKIKDLLCAQCEEDFAQVRKFLDAVHTVYTVNDQIVRGLDYYNKTTFEVISKTGLGSQNAVCGGGRYDSLVEDFDGPPTPCFGFALGMERLISLLPEDKLQALNRRPDFYLVSLGEEAQNLAFAIAHQLRAVGLYVEREFEGGSLKSQMRKANKLASRFALIVGDNEIKNQRYVLKNMDGGEQWEVSAKALAEEVLERLKSLD